MVRFSRWTDLCWGDTVFWWIRVSPLLYATSVGFQIWPSFLMTMHHSSRLRLACVQQHSMMMFDVMPTQHLEARRWSCEGVVIKCLINFAEGAGDSAEGPAQARPVRKLFGWGYLQTKYTWICVSNSPMYTFWNSPPSCSIQVIQIILPVAIDTLCYWREIALLIFIAQCLY